jgi:peptidoglycan/xylan/chitin deacetylase (PgdA/CDA1 family)
VIRPPVVLAFHGVGEATDAEDPHRLVMAPRHLEAQLRLLLRLGYRFVTAAELGDRPPPPGTAVATFDDGWRDAVTTVAPLLARLGIRGSFYVCPGWWGGRHPLVQGEAGRLLDRDEARALHELGMEVAAHTLTHPDLRGLDDARLRAELREPREELEALTGAPVRTLAYPYGLSDERVRRAAREAGYALALGWLPGPWSPYDVPRLPGPPRHGAARLGVKLLLRVRRPGR